MDALEALEAVKHAGFNLEEPGHTQVEKAVVEALEKQIPAAPLPELRFYGNGKCPRCGAVFMDKSTNYCGNCGQALNWEAVQE